MKKIIHLDADCFYASVEMLKNPDFRSIPLAVGGESSRRGVIATCNYVAREFGVRSAMPSAQARKLCPELIIVRPNFEEYRDYSKKIMGIYREFSDKIEPLSLDEAYLDVTDSPHFNGSATLIAKEIRRVVKEKTGLSVSAGVAPLKFLAKIASDWKKPDGLFVIRPSEVDEFVADIPIRLLPGVGPVTAENLSRFGIYTAKDVKVYGEEWLIRKLGKFGKQLFRMANGEDDREIKTARERKSMSVESTFSRDIVSPQELEEKLIGLVHELKRRYDNMPGKKPVYKRFVKLKFNDFTRTSVESTFDRSDVRIGKTFAVNLDVKTDPPLNNTDMNDSDYGTAAQSTEENTLEFAKEPLESTLDGVNSEIFDIEAFETLIAEALSRADKPVRLLGVGLRFNLNEENWNQMSFKLD